MRGLWDLSGLGWWMAEDERMPWEPGWGDLPNPPMGWVVPNLETGRPIMLAGRLEELGLIRERAHPPEEAGPAL